MKLFLASEVKNKKSFEKLTDYVGGFTGKTIAYIPTAANGEGWGSWKDGGSWKLAQTLDAQLELVQLEDHRTADVANLLRGKDIIWFAGGYPGYLLYWIRRTELDKNLKSILDEGSLYVGSSAGSMITGVNPKMMECFIGETEPGASCIPPLELVDFDIYPHYQEELLDQIKEVYDGKKMYLLKDGEAIIVEDESVTIFGEERVI